MRKIFSSIVVATTLLATLARAETPRQAWQGHFTGGQAARSALPLQAMLTQRHAPATATLNAPYGMAVDATGRLYVANIFGGVTIYDAHHKLTATISTGLSFPAAVQVAFDGTIYVANNGSNSVSVYSPQLSQTGSISDGTMVNPSSMELAEDGSLWVLDAAGVVHEYIGGSPAGTIATGGSAVGPWGSNFTVWGAPDGNGGYLELYQNLADALHNGVTLPSGFSGLYAGGVAEDSAGQQYVTDVVNSRVVIASTNGTLFIGAFPVASGSYGIAVDSVNHRIYVSNALQNTVTIYSLKAPYAMIGTIH